MNLMGDPLVPGAGALASELAGRRLLLGPVAKSVIDGAQRAGEVALAAGTGRGRWRRCAAG